MTVNNKDAEIRALRTANVDLLNRAETAESWGVGEGTPIPYHRQCLNCGKKVSAAVKRSDTPCEPPGAKYAACTFDMTYTELIERCKELEDTIITQRKTFDDLQAAVEGMEKFMETKSGRIH